MSTARLTMTVRDHTLFWTGIILLFLGLVWVFNGVLLPFILGAIIAYLLDPVMARLTRSGLPRWAAALIILTVFFAVIAAILAIIGPFAFRELQDLVERLPSLIDRARDMVRPYTRWIQNRLDGADLSALGATAQENIGNTLKAGGGLVSGLANSGQALAGLFALLAVTPVAAFFMMKEWPRMTGWVDGLLPRRHYDTIRDLLRQIDGKLAGFIRGQLSVAVSLALLYSVALSVAGLNFGFLIGLTAGILSFIPFVGSTFGLVTSLITAWFQSGDLGYIAVIAGIFAGGQVLETYFLTPRLVGKSVGMHPLWIIFAVMAGGALFGLVGMLLAVPVAAIIGVLGGFVLQRYRASSYYGETEKA